MSQQDNEQKLIELIDAAMSQGEAETALRLCEHLLQRDPRHALALFFRAEVYRDLQLLEQAEHAYRQVLQVDTHHSAAWSGLGTTLFDQLQFGDALPYVQRAIREDTDNAEAYYLRALIRERDGQLTHALRDYRRAARLDADGYPMPVAMTDDEVEALVVGVLHSLPEHIKAYLSQVTVMLEEVPQGEVCLHYDPPAPPSEILGYFVGTSLADTKVADPWSHFPSGIVLFRRNLCRHGHNSDLLRRELTNMLLHEICHFLGLTEEDLYEPTGPSDEPDTDIEEGS